MFHLFELETFRLYINNLTHMFKTAVKMCPKAVLVRQQYFKENPQTTMFHFSSITLGSNVQSGETGHCEKKKEFVTLKNK